MKIAFDVDVLAKQMDINRMVHQPVSCMKMIMKA